jgi:hypothetical protein
MMAFLECGVRAAFIGATISRCRVAVFDHRAGWRVTPA